MSFYEKVNMFPGWFKIEGHSNRKPKQGFKKQKEIQNKSILRKANHLSKANRNWIKTIKSDLSKQFKTNNQNRSFQKLILLCFMLVSVIIGVKFGDKLNMNFNSNNFGVNKKMTQIENELSLPNKDSIFQQYLMKGDKLLKSKNYERARNNYESAYKFGVLETRAPNGIARSYVEECLKENKNCKQAQDWIKFLEKNGKLDIDLEEFTQIKKSNLN